MNRPRRTSSEPESKPSIVANIAVDEEFDDLPDASEVSGVADADALNVDADVHETRHAAVPEAFHGQRLDKFLVSLAPEFSRNHLQLLIAQGHVVHAGKVADGASRKVHAGQSVSLTLMPTAESSAFVPERMDLPIVYEDAHLLVINKPAGLVVHPAAGHWRGTLLNGLLAHHPGAARLPRAGIVHRLDKDTSGLMVVAKTLEAQTALVRMIAAREVRREYLAMAWGVLPAQRVSIEAPIGRDPISRVRMTVIASGKPSRTDVWRLMAGEVAADGTSVPDGLKGRAVSVVLCRLHSGRTHQIRVHLRSRGHALVADTLYGGALALGMTRQALHALQLAFVHPMDSRECRFRAELPADFDAALLQLVGPAVHRDTMHVVERVSPLAGDSLEETRSA